MVEESADEGVDGSCGRISWGWKIENPKSAPVCQDKIIQQKQTPVSPSCGTRLNPLGKLRES